MNSWQVIMLPYGQYIRNYEKIDVTGPTGAEIILRHKARFKLQILVTPVTRHFFLGKWRENAFFDIF